MCSLRWIERFAFALLLSSISCSPDRNHARDLEVILCDDLAETIDYVYQRVPALMTLQEKCKRYALIASFAKPRGRLYHRAISTVLRMPDDELDQQYQE